MTSPNLKTDTLETKRAARFATISIVGTAYFLFTLVALHILRPDYNPVRRFISEYAVGPYGFLMTSALFALALGSLALVIGLWKGLPSAARSGLGLILLTIWGLGILIVGIFPTDLIDAPKTTSGNIHTLIALWSFLSLTLAVIPLSLRFRRDERWRSFHYTALVVALLTLVAFIGFMVTSTTKVAGLSQRVFIAMVLLWLLLTAIHLRAAKAASGATN
jgi:hypothetical protein